MTYLATFHLLRPEWLLALFPAALLTGFAWQVMARGGGNDWAAAVDTHLLRHLTIQGATTRSCGFAAALGIGLIAAILAMAGPAWVKAPVPAFHGNQPTVVVLSLAQSMNGADIVPSRLTRAGHKLRDILDRLHGGDAALVIYSDQPFVAAPLTSDSAVIVQMLPELSTNLMPVLGNRLDLALTEALAVLQRAGAEGGNIIVLADDAGQDAAASLIAARAAVAAGMTVNVMGVGTEAGSVLQTAQGKAIHLSDGKDMTMRLDTAALRDLAQAGHGAYAPISADDSDLQALLPARTADPNSAGAPGDLTSDIWQDMGYWLLLIPVLLAPLAFRRNLLFALFLGMSAFALSPHSAEASPWDSLWRTPDQQGQRAFDAGDFAAAAGAFTSAAHKAAALYRSGDFTAAAADFQDSYNRGNALAKAGDFEKALAAYDERLTTAPQDADAKFNRALVAKLLQQQKDKQQKRPNQKPQSGDQKDQKAADNGQDNDRAGAQQGNKSDDPGQSAAKPNEPSDKGAQTASEQSSPSAKNAAEADSPSDAAPPAQNAAHKGQGEQNPTPDPTASAFSDQMDKTLAQQQPSPDQPAGAVNNTAVLDQAAEQQLRAVPDDPSGLLRARIRQHYARLFAANP